MLSTALAARAAVCALALVMLAACANPGPVADPSPSPARSVLAPLTASTPKPDYLSRTAGAHLSMQVRGTETMDLETDTRLAIFTIYGGHTPEAVWFLSVSIADPALRSPDGRSLSFTADLSPSLYHGPGRYTMNGKRTQKVSGIASPLASAAYVRFIRIFPKPAAALYDKLVVPCTLEISTGETDGSVDCPRLADDNGKTVSLHWAWALK